MNRVGSCVLSLAIVAMGHCSDAAAQAPPGPPEETAPAAAERNPFACYGGWQAATGNRTTRQMRLELLKRIDRFEESETPGDRAINACVVGMLEQRLGIDDANDWFAAAARDQPDEAGYELFWGVYWATARGAHDVPVRDRSERHLRRALAELDRSRRAGALDEPHEVVGDWTQKRLLVLHQQDGLALAPWSAFPYEPVAEWVPELFASSQALVSVDTRGFYHESAMRTFTGEEAFAESDVRAARRLTPRERWDLARAPLRVESDNRLRVGVGPIGAFDVFYDYFRAPSSQVTSFYAPTAALNDVTVEQLGAGYERVFALDPLLDLRLAGSIRHVRREGLIEFLPDRRDEFNQVEVRPSVARFFGPDKLTLSAVYARLDIQSLPGGVPEQAMRQKVIRGGELVYDLYRPLTVPEGPGWRASRTPTRGWSFFGGAAQDDEIYGIRKVTRDDYYVGTRLAAAKPWQVRLQGTYFTSRTVFVDPNDPNLREFTDPTQTFSGVTPSVTFQLGLIDPEAAPGLGRAPAGFDLDMLQVVVPLHWEIAVDGRNDFENVRGGVELWAKIFQQRLWGAPLLSTIGYDAQYFYRLEKVMHLVHASLRLGWGDL